MAVSNTPFVSALAPSRGTLAAGSTAAARVGVGAAAGDVLRNGSFEDGGDVVSPWIFRHDVSATLSVDSVDVADGSRAAKVAVAASSTSTWLVQLRQEGVPLSSGVPMTLVFFARASAPRVVNARIQSPLAPYRTFVERDVVVGTAWQRFVVTYTPTQDVADAFVGFNLAGAAGDVWLDGVKLYETNLVVNGGFEDASLSPWNLRNDIDASLARDTTVKFSGTAAARVDVPTVGASPWFAQLRTVIPDLIPGQPYRVSFQVKGSRARSVNARVQSAVAPFPTVVERDFAITTAWQQLSFVWTPTVEVPAPFLGFNLAQDVGTVWIDDVALAELPSGTITTVAGGALRSGSAATGAKLHQPWGIALDAAGNLYIAGGAIVRKVTPAGAFSTVAGTGIGGNSGDGGPATSARLGGPVGVAVDHIGNVYIVDERFNAVRKVTPAGTISTVAGTNTEASGYSGDGGPATNASLAVPYGVAVDLAGNLYIADTSNQRVRKVTLDGTISTVAGNGVPGYSGDGGPATSASLAFPNNVAVDPAGNLYISDTDNHRVRKVSPAGVITTIAGNGISGSTGDGGPAVDAALQFPTGVAVDAVGNLYITDSGNHRVRKVTPAGIISSFAAKGTRGFSGDGRLATVAQLASPVGLAVDVRNNLYIADTGNVRVRKVTA
jgi:Carbohydrate binding domain/NHL repeat